MTRKEAIEILTASIYVWLKPTQNEVKALDMAIEALEQEETLQNLTKPNKSDLIVKGAGEIKDGLYNIKDGKLFQYKANGGTVRTYPIVSADRPTGHWIENDNGTFSCSNCQSWIPKEQHHYARHCLYCGARMESDKQ